MNTNSTKYRYVEWLSAKEMHEHSKEWLSELSFIREEQLFLKHLIESFALKPLDKIGIGRLLDFEKALEGSKHRLDSLYKQVQKHDNQLEIVTDDVNQLDMERAYRSTHRGLLMKVNKYLLEYRTVKDRGFAKLKAILKKGKIKKALGNPDYKVSVPKS
jgi:hypothetical protein